METRPDTFEQYNSRSRVSDNGTPTPMGNNAVGVESSGRHN